LVRSLLEYYEVIESIKYKVTSTLVPDVFIPSDDSFYQEEGNTLLTKSPKTTRVARNTNAIVEKLCDMTADLHRARMACLTLEEDMQLMAAFTLDPATLPKETLSCAEDALQKLVDYLN
jgi:hypothetical protein